MAKASLFEIYSCADKSDTLVEYTLPEDNNQIFAAKYLPYMPTKEELRRELKLDDFEKKADDSLSSEKSIRQIEKEQMERLQKKAKAGKLMLDE